MRLTDDQVAVTLLIQQVSLPGVGHTTSSAIKLTSMEPLDRDASALVTFMPYSRYFNPDVCGKLHAILKLLPRGWMTMPQRQHDELPPQGIWLPMVVEYVPDGLYGPAIHASFYGERDSMSDLILLRPADLTTRNSELYEFFARHLEMSGKLPASAYA